MSGESFRFLHASDFHLEQPCYGLAEAPDHLQDPLIEAPLRAVANVFETAILEDVQFVVLSGDIIAPRIAGSYALAFLMEQLEALREQKIRVYWAGSELDGPDRWPEEIQFPDNVVMFPKGQARHLVHSIHDVPIATIIGKSALGGSVSADDFRIEPTNRFTIAVAHGQADPSSLAGHKPIDYWALGGQHATQMLFESPRTAYYPGTPQGRGPDEDGVHGCTLVQVDRGRRVRPKFIPADSLRWRAETLGVGEECHRNELQRHLRARMQRIATESAGCTTFVSWTIQSEGELARQLRSGALAKELVDWLRTEFGRANPAVWTVAIEVESNTGIAEELYEEDTILGDFLRAVREHEQDPKLVLNLASMLPDMSKHRALGAALQAADGHARQVLLQEAATLGVDLLSGELEM